MSLRSLVAGWLARATASRPGAVDDATSVPPDRVVLGLGNPGPEYARTRHNVGFRVVERVAQRHAAIWQDDAGLEARVAAVELAGLRCLLVEPLTFMNRSGRCARALVERWGGLDLARDVLVVFDDLDLPTGRIRLRAEGGAGGQWGMSDVIDALESRAIPRLRFGVGHPGERGAAVVDWVLAPFPEQEESRVEAAVERAADAVEAVVADGVVAAMGRFNARS